MSPTTSTPKRSEEPESTTKRTTEIIENEMTKILEDIKMIDKTLKTLNAKRVTLTTKYENLNEEKLMIDAEAIATEQNWESGKLLLNFKSIFNNIFNVWNFLFDRDI